MHKLPMPETIGPVVFLCWAFSELGSLVVSFYYLRILREIRKEIHMICSNSLSSQRLAAGVFAKK